MFVVYNSILRRHPEHIFSVFSSAGNLFSTSIFCSRLGCPENLDQNEAAPLEPSCTGSHPCIQRTL